MAVVKGKEYASVVLKAWKIVHTASKKLSRDDRDEKYGHNTTNIYGNLKYGYYSNVDYYSKSRNIYASTQRSLLCIY